MNRQEHLLTIMAEECVEIAQRISKALRFGLAEIQPDQELSNAARIRREFCDLWAVAQMVEEESGHHVRPHFNSNSDQRAMREKMDKVERFLELSRREGTLT